MLRAPLLMVAAGLYAASQVERTPPSLRVLAFAAAVLLLVFSLS